LLFFLFAEGISYSTEAQTTYTMALGYRRPLNTDWIGYNGQNTIRDSVWLGESHLMQHFPELRPKIIRYPGGGVANWWNWKTGWFVNSHSLPRTYKIMTPLRNTLDSLKKVCDASGAIPMFVLNMVSSQMINQLQMLDSANAMGLPVKYVELGNEFYLDEEED